MLSCCCRGVLGVATAVVGKISLPSSRWHAAQQPIYVSTWLISWLVTDLGTPSPLAVKLYWLLCFAGFFFFPTNSCLAWEDLEQSSTGSGNNRKSCILDNPLRRKLSSHLRAFLWGLEGTAVHHPESVAVSGNSARDCKGLWQRPRASEGCPWETGMGLRLPTGCSPEAASGRETALLLVIPVHHSLNIRPYRKTRASCYPCPSCISPDVSSFKPWKLN